MTNGPDRDPEAVGLRRSDRERQRGDAVPGILERVTLLSAWAVCLRMILLPPLAAQSAEQGFTPVSAEVLNRPAADDWPQYRRTHDNWAHSPLDQVDRGNVGLLQLAWSRAIQPGPMAIRGADPCFH